MDSEKLSQNEKELFQMVSTDMEDHVAVESLNALAGFLTRHYGKKAIILLDEYDTPMQEAYVEGYWDELAAFTRGLFNATFKINSVADVYSLLRDSFKDILQELMEAELDASLGYEKNQKGNAPTSNKRNGNSPETLKSQYGEFQIDVPRDREGEFEPKLIPKYQRDISGIEEKVISLYARSMSTRDIHDQIQELYGMELSAEMVSKITDRILPEIKEWQSRPLNPVYPFVFMDCIHYKVREDGRILSRAAYIVLGITVEGYKDILSITVGANETSKF